VPTKTGASDGKAINNYRALALRNGQVVLFVRKQGKDQQGLYMVTLEDLLVSSDK